MPSSLLNVDTAFPELNGNESTDRKFRMVSDYLYMLREQLRYSMANLGLENFNDASFKEISGLITEPVYAQLGDVDDKMASLVLDNEKLAVRMTDAEGNISSLTQTSETFRTQIQDLNGQMTSVTQSVAGVQTQIVGLDGQVTTITQTLNGLTVQDSSGTTLIKGSRIETGSLVLTGTITWTDLASDAQNQVNGAYDAASSAQNDANAAYNRADAAYDLAISNQLPGYIHSTYIDSTEIRSPTIKANIFEVSATQNGNGGLYLKGMFNGQLYDMLSISYYGGDTPYITFDSPDGGYARWAFNRSEFSGTIDFSQADVTGLYLRFS